MQHHTDTDDAPNPVYSSIPESQVAHHQYKDNQLQHQVRGVAGGWNIWVWLMSLASYITVVFLYTLEWQVVGEAGGSG